MFTQRVLFIVCFKTSVSFKTALSRYVVKRKNLQIFGGTTNGARRKCTIEKRVLQRTELQAGATYLRRTNIYPRRVLGTAVYRGEVQHLNASNGCICLNSWQKAGSPLRHEPCALHHPDRRRAYPGEARGNHQLMAGCEVSYTANVPRFCSKPPWHLHHTALYICSARRDYIQSSTVPRFLISTIPRFLKFHSFFEFSNSRTKKLWKCGRNPPKGSAGHRFHNGELW